jgi:hypothetical protein
MLVDDTEFDERRVRSLAANGEHEQVLAYLNPWMNKGLVRAMISMADYLYGRGDKEASLRWMNRAEQSISEDDFVSPLYLASAYRMGLGAGDPEERRRKALALRERVAESGNIHVIHDMMTNYLYGLNMAPTDHERFVYWARKAAGLGSKEAARVLRECQGDPEKVRAIKRLFR